MWQAELKDGGNRAWYRLDEKTPKGETILVELSKCEDYGGKGSLAYLWYKARKTPVRLKDWWYVSVYVTDEDGHCWNRYNPQIIYNARPIIDFDWMLPATPENAQKILAEVARCAGVAPFDGVDNPMRM